jgi:hypothetical protein
LPPGFGLGVPVAFELALMKGELGLELTVEPIAPEPILESSQQLSHLSPLLRRSA